MIDARKGHLVVDHVIYRLEPCPQDTQWKKFYFCFMRIFKFSISLFSGQKRKIIVFNFESWIYPINYLLCLYSIHLNSMLPLPLAVTWWMDQRLYNCVVDISRMITDSMKVKRMKNAKKCLILFKNSFGFAQPFQILGEYTTCCLFFYDIIKCVPS